MRSPPRFFVSVRERRGNTRRGRREGGGWREFLEEGRGRGRKSESFFPSPLSFFSSSRKRRFRHTHSANFNAQTGRAAEAFFPPLTERGRGRKEKRKKSPRRTERASIHRRRRRHRPHRHRGGRRRQRSDTRSPPPRRCRVHSCCSLASGRKGRCSPRPRGQCRTHLNG